MIEVILAVLGSILIGGVIGLLVLAFGALYILHDKDYRRKEKEWESKNLK